MAEVAKESNELDIISNIIGMIRHIVNETDFLRIPTPVGANNNIAAMGGYGNFFGIVSKTDNTIENIRIGVGCHIPNHGLFEEDIDALAVIYAEENKEKLKGYRLLSPNNEVGPTIEVEFIVDGKEYIESEAFVNQVQVALDTLDDVYEYIFNRDEESEDEDEDDE